MHAHPQSQQTTAVKTAPLAPLHSMLAKLEVQTDAKRLNEIVNHPEVHPWVADRADRALDMSEMIERENALALLAEHGGVFFHRLQPGLWEAHTQILPAGRGKWALECVQACLHWLFARTEAMEVMTRCPKGNLAALALARAIHGVHEFTSPRGWIKEGEFLPADIYRLTMQDWMRTAPGLVERGAWFHDRLQAEMARHGAAEPQHPGDANHDRYVGAACEMFLGGQAGKGVVLYNRFAVMGSYAPIAVRSFSPLIVDMGTAVLEMRGEDFSVRSVRSVH